MDTMSVLMPPRFPLPGVLSRWRWAWNRRAADIYTHTHTRVTLTSFPAIRSFHGRFKDGSTLPLMWVCWWLSGILESSLVVEWPCGVNRVVPVAGYRNPQLKCFCCSSNQPDIRTPFSHFDVKKMTCKVLPDLLPGLQCCDVISCHS